MVNYQGRQVIGRRLEGYWERFRVEYEGLFIFDCGRSEADWEIMGIVRSVRFTLILMANSMADILTS